MTTRHVVSYLPAGSHDDGSIPTYTDDDDGFLMFSFLA